MNSSPLSSEEIRAAAEVHRELGPQYSDAVVQAFLEKIDDEVEARIAARIAALPQARRSPDPSARTRRRAFLAGTAVGLVGAGVPLTVLAERLAQGLGQSQNPLVAVWVVIAVIFLATAAGLTGAVTIRVSLSVKKRRARSAPISSGQEGRQTT